jgi:hypothetical protein
MQNKKLYFILTVVIVVVAVAAFVGGRMLNGQANPLGLFPIGNGQMVSIAINILPAPELPTTEPETRGMFVERKDNTIILQTVSMEMGKGGGVVVGGPGAGPVTNSDGGPDSVAPKVEVVVTNETIIYRDATEFNGKPPGENSTIQQKVEEGSLDDLQSQTMVMVWGRKNGDRIIADMIMYSNPVIFKR